jgi:hypothetical protein
MLEACYFHAMAAIQVKNVPMDLHEAIRRRAAEHGMTIGGYIMMLAEKDIERPSRAEWFRQLRRDEPVLNIDVVATLDAVRAEREQQLIDALGR